MAIINQGNITFNDVYKDGGTKHEDTIIQSTYDSSAATPSSKNFPLVNAVDIDWDGAEVDENTVLNTTGDLLTWIKNKTEIEVPETDLSNYYQKNEVYSKEEIDNAGYLTEAPETDLSNYYQKDEIDTKVTDLEAADATLAGLIDEIKNESGVQGPQGPQGDKGEAGAKGETGVQGAAGIQGPMGVQGVAGDKGAQGEMGSQGVAGTFETEILETYATKDFVSEKIAEVVGAAPEALDTLKEIADKLGEDDNAVSALTTEIATKANAGDSYTKEESDNKYLTEHQSLEGYATEIYVDDKFSQIVGTAPQNFDTLEELAAVMEDLKVVDTPAQEATYYEEGDELPEGVQVGDEKTPAVEEVSHNMTISEFVNETMQSVNEKPEIAALTKRLNDLEKFVNRYVTLTPEQQQTVANDATVTETLANTTSVTIEEGTIADIVVPETTKSTTITGELDPNSTLELTSTKGVTINNTGTEPTNLAVNAPADGSTPTVTLKSGVYDTVTVQDASLTVSNDATVQNVVITPETTKSTTINATFVDGATITSNSEAPITVTNKNTEGEEVSVTLNAPGSTVTLSGGKWTTISGEVSENTLIIKGSAKIQSLNLTKGNVIVEVPRAEDIASVISGEITLGEGYTITHRQYDITNENSSKLGGVGEMILQEDITRTSSIVAPLAPAYNAVWNLNGHNITVEGTPKSGVYLNRYSSNLEVVGTGVIHAEGTYGLWNSATTGKIIVNDGVTVEAQTHAIYAEKGTIEINGGTFKLTNADTADKDANGNFKFLLNCYDANYKAGTANIIVRGGKFYGFNPAVSYGEPDGPVNFVAEGYESVPTNEAYEYGTVYEVRKISE